MVYHRKEVEAGKHPGIDVDSRPFLSVEVDVSLRLRCSYDQNETLLGPSHFCSRSGLMQSVVLLV